MSGFIWVFAVFLYSKFIVVGERTPPVGPVRKIGTNRDSVVLAILTLPLDLLQ